MSKKEKIRIGLIILFILLMYFSTYGAYSNTDNTYLQKNGSWLALLDLLIAVIVMMIVPFVWRLINKKKFSFKKGNRICLWNSIILFTVSTITKAAWNIAFIGGLGALMFYFINEWLFVDDEDEELPKSKQNKKEKLICGNCGAKVKDTDEFCIKCGASFIEEVPKKEEKQTKSKERKNEKYTFVCSNCGTKIKESDKKCPKCGESFEEDNSENNMDQKYSDLKKLKNLLDNKIITKAEFEKEKKKILK